MNKDVKLHLYNILTHVHLCIGGAQMQGGSMDSVEGERTEVTVPHKQECVAEEPRASGASAVNSILHGQWQLNSDGAGITQVPCRPLPTASVITLWV